MVWFSCGLHCWGAMPAASQHGCRHHLDRGLWCFAVLAVLVFENESRTFSHPSLEQVHVLHPTSNTANIAILQIIRKGVCFRAHGAHPPSCILGMSPPAHDPAPCKVDGYDNEHHNACDVPASLPLGVVEGKQPDTDKASRGQSVFNMVRGPYVLNVQCSTNPRSTPSLARAYWYAASGSYSNSSPIYATVQPHNHTIRVSHTASRPAA